MAGALGQSGKSALWAGFALMMLFNLIFGRAAYHSRSKTSVVYHLLSLLITMIAAFAYLVMALELGDIWVRYADWLLSTPLLLVDLAFLAGMPSAQVLFLAAVDMMMVGSGFAAQMAYKNEAKWPMFVFSCALFGIIVMTLVQYMRSIARESAGTVEAKAYRFLSLWTLGLWSIYPILFILDNTKTIGGDIEAIIHCILDVLAKGVFGMILVGSREALEGENTAESLLAMALIGIDPLKRRSSMTLPNGIDAMVAGGSADGSAHSVAAGSKGGGPLFPTHGGSNRNLTGGGATAPSTAAITRANSGRMIPPSPSGRSNGGAQSTTRFFPPGHAHAPSNPPGSSRGRLPEASDDLEAGGGDGYGDAHVVASGSEAFATSRPHGGYAASVDPTPRGIPRAPAPAPAPPAGDGGSGDMISALTAAAMRDPAVLAMLLQAASAQAAPPVAAPAPPPPPPAPAPAPVPAAMPSPGASARGRSGSFNAAAAAAASNPVLMAAILQQLAAGGGGGGGGSPSLTATVAMTSAALEAGAASSRGSARRLSGVGGPVDQ